MERTAESGTTWRYELLLCAIFAGSLLISSIRAYDSFTWFLEVLPALIGVAVLTATRYRFRFTPLVYTLILIHSIILMVGGHYTYARVPAGDWISNALHLGRNHYDRLGHFAQGFVPALIAREVFQRRRIVKRGGWVRVWSRRRQRRRRRELPRRPGRPLGHAERYANVPDWKLLRHAHHAGRARSCYRPDRSQFTFGYAAGVMRC
jgi:hypothetical protein